MTSSDGSKSIVVRVWRHGDDIIARILVSDPGPTPTTVPLPGRHAVLEWIGSWIDGYDDAAPVPQEPSRQDPSATSASAVTPPRRRRDGAGTDT